MRMMLSRITVMAIVFALGSPGQTEPAMDQPVPQPSDSSLKADTNPASAKIDSQITFSKPLERRSEPVPLSEDLGPTDRSFSLFDFHGIMSIGLSLNYFSYKEDFNLNEVTQSFTDRFQHAPQLIGVPKSTEYGGVFGLNGSVTLYSWTNKLFIRPKAAVLFGVDNTYDGSLQGQPVVNSSGDTVGLEFDPYSFRKTNIFLFAGCDVGYAFPYFKFPLVIYTGLDFKLWYRDLMDNQGELYYSPDAGNSETYYWFSLPLGVLVTKPLSPKLMLGLDACANLMFYGGMKAAMNTGAGGSSVNYPAVALGNRVSFRMELFSQQRINDQLSIKFAPYVLFYGFEKSNIDTATTGAQPNGTTYQELFYEPASISFLAGFNILWEFLDNKKH